MHEQTTLGQRIQEGRKAAGLSQEALGEQLNVSRQAVSKWESDAAIPELENLIAMSRIFGVSIGRLLGVEPERAEEPEQPPENGGLTEKELAAVEAIAAKYAEEAQRHQRPKWSGRRKAACALAVLLLLTAGILVKRQMDLIDRRFDEVQNQVIWIQDSVSREVGSLTAQMSNILDEKNHILASSQVTVTDFDAKAQTVTLQVSASPKEWTDTTTAVFTAALSDGRQFTAEGTGQNGSFTAEDFVVPMDQAIQLSVALMDGGSARTGSLETLYDCRPENFQLEVDGFWGAIWSSSSRRIELSGLDLRIMANTNPAYPLELSPRAVDLCLYRNQETEPEQVIPVKEAVPLFQQAGYTDMSAFKYSASFDLAPGDMVVAAARVTDNLGMTSWAILDIHYATETGTFQVYPVSWPRLSPWTPGDTITP